jgi:hypothetical protein
MPVQSAYHLRTFQDFFQLTYQEEMPWYFLESGISPFTRMGGETSVFKSNNNDIY